MRHDHPVLRRDHVEPLGSILADHMHRSAAARAIGVFGRDRHMNARQMGGKRATIDAALLGALARGCRVLLVLACLVARNGLLDILECQSKLIRVELLRLAAKLHALQFVQQVLQAVILRQHLVALGNRRIPLRKRHRKPRLQHGDIGRQLICVLTHAQHGIRFARDCGAQSTT